MYLDDSAVQAHRLDPDTDELLLLQHLEQPIEHAGLSPSIHTSVDRMPIPKAFRQSTPFAAVLSYIKDRIDDGEILVRDVAALTRQKRFDASELFSGDFHAREHSI